LGSKENFVDAILAYCSFWSLQNKRWDPAPCSIRNWLIMFLKRDILISDWSCCAPITPKFLFLKQCDKMILWDNCLMQKKIIGLSVYQFVWTWKDILAEFPDDTMIVNDLAINLKISHRFHSPRTKPFPSMQWKICIFFISYCHKETHMHCILH
jgi:hypothetical protein